MPPRRSDFPMFGPEGRELTVQALQKNTKIVIVVVAVCALAGTGIYAGYVLGAPASPCSSQAGSGVKTVGVQPILPLTDSPAKIVSKPAQSAGLTDERDRLGSAAPDQVIDVVAAENFWGNLVSQLGGVHVNVTSIVTDPNTDPHEYQANDSDAIAIRNAQYVIVNNVGYDTWATGLIASDGDTNQTILNVGDSLGVYVTGGIVTGNPHLWYNPAYVNQTVAWMYHNLTTIAPSLAGYFADQYHNLTASLGSLYSLATQIKDKFAGTEVASTESIFVYLANATGLDLVSPPEFMQAVAEGNDPPDSTVVTFQCQLESGNVKLLVYNLQTLSTITSNMEAIAGAHDIPILDVTETVQPPGTSFQSWMGGQYQNLYNDLNVNSLGH
jgi:zinc/manganese transport system substrate-binding protein